jgi:hypothetical protein
MRSTSDTVVLRWRARAGSAPMASSAQTAGPVRRLTVAAPQNAPAAATSSTHRSPAGHPGSSRSKSGADPSGSTSLGSTIGSRAAASGAPMTANHPHPCRDHQLSACSGVCRCCTSLPGGFEPATTPSSDETARCRFTSDTIASQRGVHGIDCEWQAVYLQTQVRRMPSWAHRFESRWAAAFNDRTPDFGSRGRRHRRDH